MCLIDFTTHPNVLKEVYVEPGCVIGSKGMEDGKKAYNMG